VVLALDLGRTRDALRPDGAGGKNGDQTE